MMEFWVDPIEEEPTDHGFKYLCLSTDQVRFANSAGEPIPLEQVPAVVFSELMRDVDLFIGVANIGNDPGLNPGLNPGLGDRGAHGE